MCPTHPCGVFLCAHANVPRGTIVNYGCICNYFHFTFVNLLPYPFCGYTHGQRPCPWVLGSYPMRFVATDPIWAAVTRSASGSRLLRCSSASSQHPLRGHYALAPVPSTASPTHRLLHLSQRLQAATAPAAAALFAHPRPCGRLSWWA